MGLLSSIIGSISISGMFPMPTARLPSNDYEVVALSRDNWFTLLHWTTWMKVSGVVSSVALLALVRTTTQRTPTD